jgi:hypothetical protein
MSVIKQSRGKAALPSQIFATRLSTRRRDKRRSSCGNGAAAVRFCESMMHGL